MLANSLKAGFGLMQSLELASRELAHPLATDIRRMLQDINVGMQTDEALTQFSYRSGSADLDIVVTAMLIQQSTGGNLAEILETVGHTMRERNRIRGEIKTLTTQQTMTGFIIAGLPLGDRAGDRSGSTPNTSSRSTRHCLARRCWQARPRWRPSAFSSSRKSWRLRSNRCWFYLAAALCSLPHRRARHGADPGEPTSHDARIAGVRGERVDFDFSGKNDGPESAKSRLFSPLATSLGGSLQRLLPVNFVQGIKHKLIMAGEPTTVAGFLLGSLASVATMAFFAVIIVMSGSFSGALTPIVAAFSLILGFFMPKVWLDNRIRARQKLILRSLPDAFDLVTTCVEAGLGLEAALGRVAEKIEGPFGDELMVMLHDVALGRFAAMPYVTSRIALVCRTSRPSSTLSFRRRPWVPALPPCYEYRRTRCA